MNALDSILTLASVICDHCSRCTVFTKQWSVIACKVRDVSSCTKIAHCHDIIGSKDKKIKHIQLILTEISDFLSEFEGRKDERLLARVQSRLVSENERKSDFDMFEVFLERLIVIEEAFGLGALIDYDIGRLQLLHAAKSDVECLEVDFVNQIDVLNVIAGCLIQTEIQLESAKRRLKDLSCLIQGSSLSSIDMVARLSRIKLSTSLPFDLSRFKGCMCHPRSIMYRKDDERLSIERELMILSIVRHDSVIQLLGYADDQDHGTIRALVEHSAISVHDVLSHGFSDVPISLILYWLFDVLNAMQACHDVSIVIGNISTKNLLLFDGLKVKIAGFACASRVLGIDVAVTLKQPTFQSDITNFAIMAMQLSSSKSFSSPAGLIPIVFRSAFDELLAAFFNSEDHPLSSSSSLLHRFHSCIFKISGCDPRDVMGLSSDAYQVLSISHTFNRLLNKVDEVVETSSGATSVMNEFLQRCGMWSDKSLIYSIRFQNASITNPLQLKGKLAHHSRYLSQKCRLSDLDCSMIERGLSEISVTSSSLLESKEADSWGPNDLMALQIYFIEFAKMSNVSAAKYSQILKQDGINTCIQLKQKSIDIPQFLSSRCGVSLAEEIAIMDGLDVLTRFDCAFNLMSRAIDTASNLQLATNSSWSENRQLIGSAISSEFDLIRQSLPLIVGNYSLRNSLSDLETKQASLMLKHRQDWEDIVVVTLSRVVTDKLRNLKDCLSIENREVLRRRLSTVENDVNNCITLKCEIFGMTDRFIQSVYDEFLRNVENHFRAIRDDHQLIEMSIRRIFSSMSSGFGDLEQRISSVSEDETNAALADCLSTSLASLKALDKQRNPLDCMWDAMLSQAEVTITGFWSEECSESMESRCFSIENRGKSDSAGIHDADEENSVENRQVLISFLQATRGFVWNRDTNWSASLALKQWDGRNKQGNNRILMNSHGYITALALDGFSLVGNLPLSIGFFAKLEILDCSNNKLNSLPSSISNLTFLRSLIFSYNSLTYISPSIGSLSNLKSLVMCYNHIKYIPEEIGGLSQLEGLVLNVNDISNLPSSIGSLSSLKTLLLSYNPLASLPESVSNLSSLRMLDVRHCEIVSSDEQYRLWKGKLERRGLVLKI